MKISAFLLAGLLVPATLSAAQAPTAVLAPILAAQDDEPRVIPALKAVVMLPAAPASGETLPVATAPVDTSRLPLLDSEHFRFSLAPFLDQPVSLRSLERLEQIVRIHLEFIGYPLANVYTPPQDVTDGVLRVVVRLAELEGHAKVAGARWFSELSYVSTVRAKSGAPLDLPAINADLAWLNRNPFRQVTASAEAGTQRGTTRLVLNTQEKLPLELNAGYSNSGTKITDEDRVNAGLLWGNALGRGDLVRYGYSADPASQRLRSHSGSYTAFLPWRHVFTVQGAWSRLTPEMPVPFVQRGTSWQAGARYDLPLKSPRLGWTQSLSLSADFKYSDNTLEFAAFPVTDNETHVAQLGATYGVGFAAFGARFDLNGSVVASPGGLTARNGDRALGGSRPGAEARYAYGKFGARFSRPLPRGFNWSTSLDAQFASAALLGSEQLGGGGSSAVRGYRESSAFGDRGVVVNHELHAPGFSVFKGNDRLGLFAFVDFASLALNVDREGTDLRSTGLGLNYQWRRTVSVRASHGWQLKRIDRSSERGRCHVSAMLNW